MTMAMRRGIWNAVFTPNNTRPSSSLMRCFSSSSSSSSSMGSRVKACASAELVADEDLIYTEPTTSSTAAALLPSLLQPRVVIYDGVCHLCHAGVKRVIKADKYRKIKFCCLQSKTAEPYLKLCGVVREDVLRRFLFIEGPGLYHQASTAALKVASYLPLPYSALSAFLVIPTPLRDCVYDYVAKHRYEWFGKEDSCIVSREPDMLERFIDREEMKS